ncbi:uncharacterized protein LOC122659754 isoform X2 [Telopea speciosissima]|uniref:uncharacterized protein LOC122659754 isoform X2 n=1 Tax=Telopea speciosissima TaxID=54955 RepID=UPI001CC3B6E1|nr:uncharacterized protein LOC122659754 isoform X2 [Telopea speciosissima]
MLRLCIRRTRRFPIHTFSSSSSSSRPLGNPTDSPKNLQNPQHVPPPPPVLLHHSSTLSSTTTISASSSALSRKSLFALSAIIASAVLISTDVDRFKRKTTDIYADLEYSVHRSSESFKKVLNQMKNTGVAAGVLWKSLSSVLSTANQEVRSGFELRVAALLADIAAANDTRRSAIVSAGGGAVVDWLLETVASSGDNNSGTQAESARALAHLIADPKVCEAVLGRPHAVPYLLRFIFSFQPQRSKQIRRSSFDVSDTLKGRSMLVAAIMDIVTSNCDNLDGTMFQPSLPGNADMRDIAAAIQVIEEGGMHFDASHGNDNDKDGGKGIRGVGIKVLGGTTVLGLSRTNGSHLNYLESVGCIPRPLMLLENRDNCLVQGNLAPSPTPGLWDDLQGQHVAVPFATWALANWALASDVNRSHIQELDQDGYAVMIALMAPERTVKWHGSLVARLLLEDLNLPLTDSVPDWSFILLSTVSQASKTEDITLARMALSAFLVSVQRSPDAQRVVMEKGLHLMRETAKRTQKHKHVQEALAKALELLSTGDKHLSIEESKKWSGILLPWVFGKFSSDITRFSATKILSRILEDCGPYSIPISQGWLALLLIEVLGSSKTTSFKKSTQLKGDKVKTQIDHSNAASAAQIASQLAGAVVNRAGKQLSTTTDSVDMFPLADLLSLEPFAGPLKNMNKNSSSKFDAADSAVATLKGIKALSEVCTEDSIAQNKIADLGVLCLLRRFLLRDDYEQLAAIEAYDASRVREMQDRTAQDRTVNVSSEANALGANNSSSVRVPPTAHIRRHAAQLLTVLSVLPKVQKAVVADETWCKWLEDCANGKIPGCNDLKIRSYARATLLNIFCSQKIDGNPVDGSVPDIGSGIQRYMCPSYEDKIFLINPELPHWKSPEKTASGVAQSEFPSSNKPFCNLSAYHEESVNSDGGSLTRDSNDRGISPATGPGKLSQSEVPLLDVVFVHGLRGGPFKTWRMAEDKSSTTKSGLVETIDLEAGKEGTFWPGEWLSADFPQARLFSVKYKTNLTQWSGASLPLQEVSSLLLKRLTAAGIGSRPVVFVTHSMGGLVVKQMLYQAREDNLNKFINNTIGVVFYSCPHFGSKLADMPWRMGLVLRPAPTIGELRSGSPRLVEFNDFIRHLHNKGLLEVLSFSETKVTPIVEGYGGWAFRMEIVPIESAYPGFGELVVLDSSDHINSCKPVSRTDPSYTQTLHFMEKLKAHCR